MPVKEQVDPKQAISQFALASKEVEQRANAQSPAAPSQSPKEPDPIHDTPADLSAQKAGDAQVSPATGQAPSTLGDEWAQFPKKADDWKRAKAASEAKIKERDDKIASLAAEIAQAKAQGASTQELELLRKERDDLKKNRDELSEIVARQKITDHPGFQAAFDGKRQEQVEYAKSLLGDKSPTFEAIISMPEGPYKKQLAVELLDDLDSYSRTMVGGALQKISEIELGRQRELANWKQTAEKIQAEEINQRRIADEQRNAKRTETDKAWQQHLNAMQDKEKGLPVFQTREKDENWNAGVQQRIEYANRLFSGNIPPQEAFKAITNAASYDAVLQQNLGLMKEVERLNGVVKGMQSASPSIRGGGESQANGSTADEEIKPGMKPQEVTAAFHRGLQRRLNQQG